MSRTIAVDLGMDSIIGINEVLVFPATVEADG